MNATGYAILAAAALGGAYWARIIGPKVRVGDDVPVHYASLAAQVPLVPQNAFAVILHVTGRTDASDGSGQPMAMLQGTVTGWSDANGSILAVPVPAGAAISVSVPESDVVASMKVDGAHQKLLAA